MTSQDWLEKAQELAPLFRETAREAEIARRPLERVIDAVRETGLYSMMVPKALGGGEEDLDTFFEVVLTLSRADASMGWLTGFLIEHNLWLLNYSDDVCKTLYGTDNFVLAPATLNIGAGTATSVDGGYRLSGQWQWGTGILQSTWVLAGGLAIIDETPTPTFFLMPIEDVQPIDTWFMTGMCATGSWDFKVDDVFIPEERAIPFLSILNNTTGIAERFDGPLYSTPLMPVLGFAAGLPILGAAQSALADFSQQMATKLKNNVPRAGSPQADVTKVLGEVSLKLDAAELVMRNVCATLWPNATKPHPPSAISGCPNKPTQYTAAKRLCCKSRTCRVPAAATWTIRCSERFAIFRSHPTTWCSRKMHATAISAARSSIKTTTVPTSSNWPYPAGQKI